MPTPSAASKERSNAPNHETLEMGRTKHAIIASPWKIGDACEGRYKAQKFGVSMTMWYKGTIMSAPDDEGRCDVEYEDGDEEDKVPAKFLRPPRSAKAGASSSSAPAAPARAAPAPAPPPPTAPSGAVGKRKVKATTVMVDGHAVKRQNLYDMEEGEGSVWDRELSGKVDAAFEYRDRTAPRTAAAPKPPPKKPSAPRAVSADEARRIERNDAMKSAKDASAGARARFLEPHRAVLERFGARLPVVPGKAKAGDSFVEDERIGQPAEVTGAQMRDYQLRGLRWLVGMHKCGVNAILADEMGLGKTLQTIAFLAHLKFVLRVPGPHLVICPLSVLSSWMIELKRFCPALKALKLHSSDPDERKRLMGAVGAAAASGLDVVVTTYEMAKSPNVHSQLASRSWWRYLIIDEGHVIKNDASQISQAVRKFHFAHALLLTGTPLQNNLHELWALLNFLYPDVFTRSDAFDSAFELRGAGSAKVDNEQLTHAAKLLRPFMLRRVKEDVEKGMPPKLETTIACPLSEYQVHSNSTLIPQPCTPVGASLNDSATGVRRALGGRASHPRQQSAQWHPASRVVRSEYAWSLIVFGRLSRSTSSSGTSGSS